MRQRRARTKAAPHDAIQVKGFARLALRNVVTGQLDYDSGWVPNNITQTGFEDMIVGPLGAIAASSRPTHIVLATQSSGFNSTQTSASGEFDSRKAATFSFVSPGTLQGTAQWATDEATQSTLGGLGFYGTSSGGSIGNVAFLAATVTKNTQQTLSATLQWRFS